VNINDNCVPAGCNIPGGDGIIIYYDKADVTLNWSPNTCPGGAPASLNIGITLSFDGITPSWASAAWPTGCYDNKKGVPYPVNIADINYRADLPVLGTESSNIYAAVDNLRITAKATPSFTTSTGGSWGPDEWFSFPPGAVNVSNVTLTNFYVQALTWSCSIFGWNPCAELATWINGLISGAVQGYVTGAVQNALNTQLPAMLNSALGLPLNINALFGEPFNLSQNCYLLGMYPANGATGMTGDCYGIKFPLDFGMLPAIYTPYYSSNNASCDQAGININSFNPTNVLLTNPPTTKQDVAANVFNSSTVPSGPYAGQPYDIGIGMSQDVLNELLYNIYLTGLTRVDINVNKYPSLASYLNVNAFAALSPAIVKIADPNSYVSILLIPRSSGTNNPPPTFLQLGHTLSQQFASGTLSTNMIYAELPNYQIDFYAMVGGVKERMFTLNWDLKAGLNLDYLVPQPLPPSTYGVLQVNFLLVPRITQIVNIYPGITPYMVHGIAQVIPFILSTALGGYIKMPINLGALGINVGFWYIGPDVNAADADANGTPDFLSGYAYAYGPLDWATILGAPRYQALEQNGAPRAYIVVPNGKSIGMTSGPLALSSLSINGKQSKLLNLKPKNSIINFTGYDPMNYNAPLEYSYSIDGGLWSPFTTSTQATLPVLTEGVHMFEVMAKNKGNFSNLTPACLTFRVDTVPPSISVGNLKNGASVGSSITLNLKVSDYQTSSNELAVAYSLDGSPFKPVGSLRKIALYYLAVGSHHLVITATDNSGNTSKLNLNFVSKASSSLGCGWGGVSTGTGGYGSGAGAMFILILGLGFLMLKRKIVLQRQKD